MPHADTAVIREAKRARPGLPARRRDAHRSVRRTRRGADGAQDVSGRGNGARDAARMARGAAETRSCSRSAAFVPTTWRPGGRKAPLDSAPGRTCTSPGHPPRRCARVRRRMRPRSTRCGDDRRDGAAGAASCSRLRKRNAPMSGVDVVALGSARSMSMRAVDVTYRNDMLAGQVALVVGGSSGIGAAIAAALADAGAVVTVTGATRSEVDAARAEPGFCGARRDRARRARRACGARADRRPAAARRARQLRGHHPPRRRTRRCRVRDVLAINLTGTMRCCTMAREKLRAAAGRDGGVIVNTASVLSFQGGRACRRTARARAVWRS